MKFPDFIEQLILSKPYSQLTAEEKNSLSEYISNEDEYNTVKGFIANMQVALIDETTVQPALDTKTKLMATFVQTHKKKSGFGVIHGKRLLVGISVAASLVIAVGVVWVFLDREKTPDTIAVVDTKKETQQNPEPDKQTNSPQEKSTQKIRPKVEEQNIEPKILLDEQEETENVLPPIQDNTITSFSAKEYDDLVSMTVTIF